MTGEPEPFLSFVSNQDTFRFGNFYSCWGIGIDLKFWDQPDWTVYSGGKLKITVSRYYS